MVEQGIHVVTVGTARGSRHAEQKLRLKVIDDGAIPRRARAMSLVDHDVVEFVGTKLIQVPRERPHHREQAG